MTLTNRVCNTNEQVIFMAGKPSRGVFRGSIRLSEINVEDYGYSKHRLTNGNVYYHLST